MWLAALLPATEIFFPFLKASEASRPHRIFLDFPQVLRHHASIPARKTRDALLKSTCLLPSALTRMFGGTDRSLRSEGWLKNEKKQECLHGFGRGVAARCR